LAPKLRGTGRIIWEKDGKNGPSDPNNSANVLLQWLTTEGNFARFRGNKEGKKKFQICDEIVLLLQENEVKVSRNAKMVLDKIQSMETKFKAAHDWAGDTGQGVDVTEADFEAAVKKRCKYYYDLLPVMGDRSGFRALATTRDIAVTAPNQQSPNTASTGNRTDSDTEYGTAANTVTAAVTDNLAGEGNAPAPVDTIDITLPPTIGVSPAAAAQRSAASVLASTLESLTGTQKRQRQGKRGGGYSDKFLTNESDFLAKLESLKSSTNDSWKSKSDEIEYKMKCVRTYKELKDSGWKRPKIHKTFPELKGFSESDEESSNIESTNIDSD
jgi:hypothetical protein